jgi:hypothetical protein
VIEDYAFAQGAGMGADPAGLAAGALAVCAAAIPDRIELRVKRYGGWNEATRLWVGLVGDPGTKKTPIIRQVVRPLERIDSELWYAYATAKAEWDALDKETKRLTPPPPQTRVKLDDATVEAAQEILRDSPDGVLYLRDELSGFFGSIDKYASHRGAAADRGFWLQAYNGDAYTFDRVKRGSRRHHRRSRLGSLSGCRLAMTGTRKRGQPGAGRGGMAGRDRRASACSVMPIFGATQGQGGLQNFARPAWHGAPSSTTKVHVSRALVLASELT